MIFNRLDRMLNSITMYQLMVYGLSSLLAGSVLLSLTHTLSLPWDAIVLSSAIGLTTALIADRSLSILWGAPSNMYSSLITSLILCCILPPATSAHRLALIALANLIAISSKYVLAYKHKHLFNPAAIAALIMGITSLLPATWWVGSPAMLPLTILLGLAILRKLHRFQLFFTFLAAGIGVALLLGLRHGQTPSYIVATLIASSPVVFFGTVMLAEPATLPPRHRQRYAYGILVGIVITSQVSLGVISATPELALVLGNIYAYTVSTKQKLRLYFKGKRLLGPQLYEFTFSGAHNFSFLPGQYLEWTLPQHKNDMRGNRRFFSITSAPRDDEICLAIRLSEPSSRFKKDLMQLKAGDSITASSLAGDFVLPTNLDEELVFIAGGIGITPFVSMARSMLQNQEKRNVALLYLFSSESEYCYQDIWRATSSLGLRVIPILTGDGPAKPSWHGLTGRLTEAMLEEQITDYASRRFYISGPPGLVAGYTRLLKDLGIKQKQITRDYFSGY